jgi:hypothetical protein
LSSILFYFLFAFEREVFVRERLDHFFEILDIRY